MFTFTDHVGDLLLVPRVSTSISRGKLGRVFVLNPTGPVNSTIFGSVGRLPPTYFVVIDNRGARVRGC